MHPALRILSPLVSAGLLAGVALVMAGPQETGGIIPTDYRKVSVDPGPEPSVTFFATGDGLGKIEPCG